MNLKTKAFFFFVPASFLVMCLVVLVTQRMIHHVLVESMIHRGLSVAEYTAHDVTQGINEQSEAEILPFIQSNVGHEDISYVYVQNPSGKVLAHTNVSETGKTYSSPDISAALKSDKSITSFLSYQRENHLDISYPIWEKKSTPYSEEFLFSSGESNFSKKRIGTLHLGISLKELSATEHLITYRLIMISAGSCIAVLFFVGLFFNRMLSSILFLSKATEKISAGQYGSEVPVSTDDELGRLAKSFNKMSRDLSTTTVSKNFLSLVMDSMPDSLFVTKKDGSIKMVNHAVCSLTGFSAQEIIGKNVLWMFSQQGRIWGQLNNAMENHQPLNNLELFLNSKKGEPICVRVSASALRTNQGEEDGFIFIAQDLTERKKFEARMIQNEKLSAVGQLAAGVAHEINNPLGVILGFTQALIRRTKEGDTTEMPLKSVEREALRCKSLVQDLLTFSRVSKVEREPLDINKTILSALSLIAAQAKMGNITVQKELAADIPYVFGNANQIEQVIINLANNAMDAVGQSGTVTVKTELLKDGPLSWVCMRIIDSGPGIPPEILNKIFEPFFTTKAPGKGTGLGLSLILEIVKKHSGTIDVNSRPGLTEFCVKFPVRVSGR